MRDAAASYAEAINDTVPLPLLVVDTDLRVESANRPFLDHFKVKSEDTLGTVLHDLGNGQWNIPELRKLLEEVLTRSEAVKNYRVEHEFESIGKRIFFINARRLAYEGKPDAVLIAFFDVTEREELIFELEAAEEFSTKLIDSVRESLLVLGWDLRVQSANQSFYENFRVKPGETEGRLIYELGNGQWNIPKLRELLEGILPDDRLSTTMRSRTCSPESESARCFSTPAASITMTSSCSRSGTSRRNASPRCGRRRWSGSCVTA